MFSNLDDKINYKLSKTNLIGGKGVEKVLMLACMFAVWVCHLFTYKR